MNPPYVAIDWFVYQSPDLYWQQTNVKKSQIKYSRIIQIIGK